mmetsp:Transcript_84208/g.146224  ORF Transcript_84208/g.146224 Transcript_84208/m.146224 type:complete len:389 (-) Transcript_84208:49-1215(-)
MGAQHGKVEEERGTPTVVNNLSRSALQRQVSVLSSQSDQSLSGYIQHLVDKDGDPARKRRICCEAPGLEDTAVEFARVLQEMIGRSLRNPPRLRIFDNHTLDFKIDGQPANFTACRCSQFQRLRAAMKVSEEDYLTSLCMEPFLGGEKAASGKSGSLFLRSHDNRFVLKTIEQHEFDVLEAILPSYLLYLEENDSLLCRFVGAYSLAMRRRTLRLVVMSNVLPSKPDVIYDLKGTTEDRWVDPVCNAVLKDNNFHPFTLFFKAEERRRLLECVKNDTQFLESVGTMDYSLLLGVSSEENERFRDGAMTGWLSMCNDDKKAPKLFQMGIIDYLQRWTPKKVAAHWLKKPTLGCCHEIDTEPPMIYCSRFFKYMDRKMQCYSEGFCDLGR